MKNQFKLLSNAFLVIVFANLHFMACTQTTKLSSDAGQAKVKNLRTSEFFKMAFEKPDDVVVLDVRTPEEWEEGIIENAKRINFYDSDFETQLDQFDPEKPIMVYCKSGGRSGSATEILEKKGFKKIYNLDGGITSWNEAGLPTVDF
jgi:phage shock protein E